MSGKDSREKLVDILRAWQQIENRSATQSGEIVERTRNPVIRLVTEIFRRDSAMHYRVQQFIIDSIDNQSVTLTVKDLEQVWAAIEAHMEAERKTIELVRAAQEALSGTQNVVQQFLLSYLATDEKKHDQLLEHLSLIKRGMYSAV